MEIPITIPDKTPEEVTEKKKTKRRKPDGITGGKPQEPKLNTYQKHELNQKVVDLILANKGRQEVLQLIEIATPVPLSKTGMQNVYEFAQQWIQENVMLDAKTIINIHIIWYKEMQQYFESIDNVPGQNRCRLGIERLLGLHKTKTVAKINRKTNINLLRPAEYDTTKLLPEQRKRLEQLINKSSS